MRTQFAAALAMVVLVAPAKADAPGVNLKGPGFAFCKELNDRKATPFKDATIIWLEGFIGALQL